ncbi:MAG: hypothetical protein KUG49_01795 [Dokdonia sp.]|jgi:hypothetical protein|nr:hypothetical protein [Dokdonia sp.]
MKNLKHRINRIAIYAALFSLAFGFTQLIIFIIYPNEISITIGIAHLYPTVILHLILLTIVIINSFMHRFDYREHLKTIGWMLFNIPMAFLCYYLVLIRY